MKYPRWKETSVPGYKTGLKVQNENERLKSESPFKIGMRVFLKSANGIEPVLINRVYAAGSFQVEGAYPNVFHPTQEDGEWFAYRSWQIGRVDKKEYFIFK